MTEMNPADSSATKKVPALIEPSVADLPPSTRFDMFLAEAARRRRQKETEPERSGDWYDADPAAALALPAESHPARRAEVSFTTERGQRDLRWALRRMCAHLAGIDGAHATWDDVLSYPWHHLTPDQAADYRRHIYRQYQMQTTRNDYVCRLRSVVRACYAARLISPLRRDLIMDELRTIAPGRSTKTRRLSHVEFTALMEACAQQGTEAARARNSAIAALFRTTGMRSCELVRLTLADWDRAERTILLRDTKNGTHHTVFVHPSAEAFLVRWVGLRGSAPGALFHRLRGAAGQHITTSSLREMMKTRREAAGLPHFGCHDFRRTFATELLRTHDHSLVSKLMNHRKLSSTLVYDLADDDLQRSAVESFDLAPPTEGEGRPEPDESRE